MGGSEQQRRNHIDELLDRIEAERERIQQQLTQSQESHAGKAASARTLRLKRVWLIALWLAISLAILIRNVVRGHPRASAVTAVVGATALAVVLLPAHTAPRFPEAGAPTPRRATPTPPLGNPLAAAVQPGPAAPPQTVVVLPQTTPQVADSMLLLPRQDERPIPPTATPPTSSTPQPNQPEPPPSNAPPPPSSTPPSHRPPVCLEVLPGVHVQLDTCLSTVVGLLDNTTKGN